jgi:hypothetical protein
MLEVERETRVKRVALTERRQMWHRGRSPRVLCGKEGQVYHILSPWDCRDYGSRSHTAAMVNVYVLP